MDVDQQLKILRMIWRRSRGYVFLPWIPKEWASTPERKEHFHNGPAFKTDDFGRIRDHLVKHRDDDLYFSPMVFSGPHRRSNLATRSSRLWADLDEVNPRTIPDDLTPAILWQTSPGRYAAVWMFGTARAETTERGGENHKLTIALGADPSGWDTTQLLRVPGSANNKPGYRKGLRGKLVHAENRHTEWEEIDALPEIPEADVVGGDLIDEQILESIDVYEAYAKYRTKLPGIIRSYLRMRDDGGLDRSAIAWQIERELADAGATLLELVAIIRPTPWNKFEGRQDELKRLTLECGKALALKKVKEPSALDTDTEVKYPLVPFWNNESYLNAPEPEWLYDEFIPHGGCGFIAGIPKSMKTWLAMDLAISSAIGVPYLGYKPRKPFNVLYVQREDPTTLVRARHHVIATSKHPRWTLECDLKDIRPYPGRLYVETMMAIELNDPGWQVWLAESIRDNDLDLVIFDTLVRCAPGVEIDSATATTAEVLNPVKDVARENDCAIAFVHHNTKSQSNERAGQNMAGSGQFHAWADFGLYVTHKDESKPGRAILSITHETKYTGSAQLKFAIDGLPDVWDPQEWVTTERTKKGNPTFEDLEDAKAPAAQRIREFFRQNPDATGQECATALGVGIRTVRRYKKG
jgi:hypothetical protein